MVPGAVALEHRQRRVQTARPGFESRKAGVGGNLRDPARWCAVAIALGGSLLAAAPAGAASTWLAPVNLSGAGQDVLGPQVDVDAQGNAVTVWARSNGSRMIAQGAVRPAGGAWQAAVDLSAGGTDGFHQQIAVDAQGNAIAVWNRGVYVQVAERPVGGAWRTPLNLSLVGGSATTPQVSVDPRGNAMAVWSRGNGADDIIQAASRPAGGSWTTPVDISVAGQDANTSQVALDRHGNAVAVWSRFNGANTITQAALHPACLAAV